MIQLVDREIDAGALLRDAGDSTAGAAVLFLGTTRQITDDRETASLDYDCYRQMAEKKLAELEKQAKDRWDICQCAIVHRLGHVPIGEASVAVVVTTPHRGDAFEAARWLIDTLKEEVPIWKKENWADGTSEWVHPGTDGAAVPRPMETPSAESRS